MTKFSSYYYFDIIRIFTDENFAFNRMSCSNLLIVIFTEVIDHIQFKYYKNLYENSVLFSRTFVMTEI